LFDIQTANVTSLGAIMYLPGAEDSGMILYRQPVGRRWTCCRPAPFLRGIL